MLPLGFVSHKDKIHLLHVCLTYEDLWAKCLWAMQNLWQKGQNLWPNLMTESRLKKLLNVGQSLPTCSWWDWSYWAFQRGLTHLEPLCGTAVRAAAHVRLQCYAKVSKAGGEAVVRCVMSEFGGKIAGSSFYKNTKTSGGLLLAVACWCHCFGVSAFNLPQGDVANKFQRLQCDFTGKLPDVSIFPEGLLVSHFLTSGLKVSLYLFYFLHLSSTKASPSVMSQRAPMALPRCHFAVGTTFCLWVIQ